MKPETHIFFFLALCSYQIYRLVVTCLTLEVDQVHVTAKITGLQSQNTIKSKIFGHAEVVEIILKFKMMWLYHRVMLPKGADGMANSVDPDQTGQTEWQTL